MAIPAGNPDGFELELHGYTAWRFKLFEINTLYAQPASLKLAKVPPPSLVFVDRLPVEGFVQAR